ncbi:MAG: TonB-dependent receptor [Lewinellaceae bacterium]|nr:TonB-dependent receptor [Saprospiraceae bacterium]MCB9333977.1 TonB-dependent receptor [Lewinellaceae bacterium]
MKKLLILILLYTTGILNAQESSKTVYGIVTNEKEELLIGATVQWAGTLIGTITDTLGRFWIPRQAKAAKLQVTYVGYDPAQVEILPHEDSIWVEVMGITQIKEVTVSDDRFDTHVSTLETRNVESIHRNELRKAPCCNLSESFETNGVADVTYSNALTGVKEIQMLGLRGIYSQFMVENRPTLTGIATPFAFEFIPGTWLNGIQLAKGASTVNNGYTGITGQVNADLVKPHTDHPLFVNAFTSTEGRGELNVHMNKKGKGKISHGLLTHASIVENKWDMNDDNFYDAPNRHQLNGLYRVFYEGPEVCAQFNVQALTDRRTGGQIRPIDGIPGLFGVDQQNDRVEVWGKMGREHLFGKPYIEIGNIVSASWHHTEAVYGSNRYQATQRSVYWQSLFQTIIGTTDHKVVFAPSVQHDNIDETVNEGDLGRTETVPGAMAEYTFSRPNLDMGIPDLVVVLGGRADWNSRFGWFLTPRLSAKYNFSIESVVRISAGRGFRSPNLIAENISLLASNRPLHFAADLGYEEAWNYGINFTQNFKLAGRSGSFSFDFYRTNFQQQILVDVDQSPTDVFFYNVDGKSFSNSLLATLQYAPLPGLDVKLVYKWNDVRATFADGQTRAIPLVAKHRGLLTLDYTTPNKKWMFNTNVQLVGPQRLPDNSQIPHEYAHDFHRKKSPVYGLWSAQITRSWKKVEFYLGGENLTGFQQHQAIIAVNEPNSPYFNGSQLWAPVMGTVGYLGVRFSPSGL